MMIGPAAGTALTAGTVLVVATVPAAGTVPVAATVPAAGKALVEATVPAAGTVLVEATVPVAGIVLVAGTVPAGAMALLVATVQGVTPAVVEAKPIMDMAMVVKVPALDAARAQITTSKFALVFPGLTFTIPNKYRRRSVVRS